jgi:transcriptional regulator with XRE-family HTH domain
MQVECARVPKPAINADALQEFGQRVRARRTELGSSQETLAAKSGLHRTYISSVELGERNVSLRNIILLAKALEFDPSNLVEGLN